MILSAVRAQDHLAEHHQTSYSNIVDQGVQTSTNTHTIIGLMTQNNIFNDTHTHTNEPILYLVRPHEANEKNGGKSNGEDVDSPEPGTLMGGQ